MQTWDIMVPNLTSVAVKIPSLLNNLLSNMDKSFYNQCIIFGTCEILLPLNQMSNLISRILACFSRRLGKVIFKLNLSNLLSSDMKSHVHLILEFNSAHVNSTFKLGLTLGGKFCFLNATDIVRNKIKNNSSPSMQILFSGQIFSCLNQLTSHNVFAKIERSKYFVNSKGRDDQVTIFPPIITFKHEKDHCS